MLASALALGCSLNSSGIGNSNGNSEGTSTMDPAGSTSPTTTGTPPTSAGTGDGTMGSGITDAVDSTTTSPTGPTSGSESGSSSDETTAGVCERLSTACLVGTGLLVRYFLDEAESGDGPNEVLDSAPDPLDLPIDWNSNMRYVTENGNTGLEWQAASSNGSAFTSVEGTKLALIDGQTSATIEAVFEVQDADSSGSRVVHFGEASEGGLFTLRLESVSAPRLTWNHEVPMGQWSYNFQDMRAVVHVVFDSTEAIAQDRRRLYVDGQLVGPPSGEEPNIGAAIDLFLDESDPDFALGNRANGFRSMAGILFYAALYTEALTPDEIQTNAQILAIDDDRPQ